MYPRPRLNPVNVKDAGPTLTKQLVCPAVERLTGDGVLVLLVVLNRPEVSQGPHEAPEVHLILSKTKTASSEYISHTQKTQAWEKKKGLIICGCTGYLDS